MSWQSQSHPVAVNRVSKKLAKKYYKKVTNYSKNILSFSDFKRNIIEQVASKSIYFVSTKNK